MTQVLMQLALQYIGQLTDIEDPGRHQLEMVLLSFRYAAVTRDPPISPPGWRGCAWDAALEPSRCDIVAVITVTM
jgi:hypothetical protein